MERPYQMVSGTWVSVLPRMLYAMNDYSMCSCGGCESCRRRAALSVVRYVLKRRRGQRKPYTSTDPEERQYVQRQIRMLLAMTGLGDEGLYSDGEMQRSAWGRAMRAKQESQ